MASKELHESLKPISWLLGQWVCDRQGKGKYPTIKDFGYTETLDFTCVGQPMFNLTSTSSHPEKGNPLHQERGFLRIRPQPNQYDLILSHNFGMTTIETGIYNPNSNELVFNSSSITRIENAKHPFVMSLARTYKLVNTDELELVLCMETENTQMCEHLRATYRRV